LKFFTCFYFSKAPRPTSPWDFYPRPLFSVTRDPKTAMLSCPMAKQREQKRTTNF